MCDKDLYDTHIVPGVAQLLRVHLHNTPNGLMNAIEGETMFGRVLIVDHNRRSREAIANIHRNVGWETATATTCEEALAILGNESFDVVYLDLVKPDRDGVDAFGDIRQLRPDQVIVILARKKAFARAVETTELGALYFVEPKSSPEQFLATTKLAVEFAALRRDTRTLRDHPCTPGTYLGESPSAREILQSARDIAAQNSRVLISGEAGTGKELIARMIHDLSDRREHPFIKVNCAGVPEDLIESILHGSTKNAVGKLQAAAGGTLFLAAVDEFGKRGQTRLLKALARPTTDSANVRVIASATRHLGEEVAAGRFREDLYRALCQISVACPPLCERVEDILPLAKAFIAEFCSQNSIPPKSIDREVIERLNRYPWPYNVRELRNQIERMVFMCPSRVIQLEDLSAELRAGVPSALMTRRGERVAPVPELVASATGADSDAAAPDSVQTYVGLSMYEARRRFEHDIIVQALEVNDWNITHAAEELGMERTNLHKKMKMLGITPR